MTNGDFSEEELKQISENKIKSDEKKQFITRKSANTEEMWNIIELKKMARRRKK